MSNNASDSRAATYAVAPGSQDGELLNIGQQCSATEQKCTVVDYLPYVCDHCKKRFCSDHRMPEAHSCEKWDQSMADRRALECELFVSFLVAFKKARILMEIIGPLCSELIAIPPGEDPNLRLGRHVDRDCVVMHGKTAKQSTTPTCSRARCGKPLWQPITCDVRVLIIHSYGCSGQVINIVINFIRNVGNNFALRIDTLRSINAPRYLRLHLHLLPHQQQERTIQTH